MIQQRKAVYTFIIGDYDTLKTPTVLTRGWDYICFTDNPKLRSDVWDVRLSTRRGADSELEDKKFAMKHMIMFHQYLDGYELSLSIIGQMQINCNLDDFLREHFKDDDDMMICRHPERDCIYDEGEACKTLRKDDSQRIDAQMARYRAEQYPRHNGLYATGIIARRHDRQNLKDMCALWFEELKEGSKRDQLSLNYAIWRSAPIRISEINYQKVFFTDRNFIFHPHLQKLYLDELERERAQLLQALQEQGRWARELEAVALRQKETLDAYQRALAPVLPFARALRALQHHLTPRR